MTSNPPHPRRIVRSWSIVGALLAAVGYVLALRPSLLPRNSLTQAMACALVAMTLYAVGAIIEGLVRASRTTARATGDPSPSRDRVRWIRWTIAGIAFGIAATFTPQAVRWQDQQFDITGVPGPRASALAVIGLTLVICAALLMVARLLRWSGRAFGRRLEGATHWSFPVRTIVGGLLTTTVVAMLVAGGLGLTYLAFTKINNSVPSAQAPPTTGLRSGGPGSLIPWSSLGVQGRDFVQGGPTPGQITAVTGRRALEPIRVFAGVESADSAQARADLAVADLSRAGAFARKAIVVYTPSTNGLVDPTSSAAAEYVADGDVASVALQYTVLPSFLSLILSQDSSLEAGTALLNTVRAKVATMPETSQPKIYVYGESLGAFGSQAPFAGKGVVGVTDQVEGAIWAGPPANSAYWQQISGLSTSGPTWQPIVEAGEVFRFAANAEGLLQPPAAWGSQRAVYLQNATDAVVWWSPSLILSRPGWLDSPRGPDVPVQMRWLPLISFEQVLVDMPAAGSMPPGIGHNYLPNIGPAWISVMQPTAWGTANTARLQAALE